MKKSLLGFTAAAASLLCVGLTATAAPVTDVCDGADLCVYEGYEDGTPNTIWGDGVKFGLDFRPDLADPPAVGDSGLVAAAMSLESPTIDDMGSPDSALCPANGQYVVIASDMNGYLVQVMLTSGCFCGFDLNPALRTFILAFDNAGNLESEPANLFASGNRCDGSTEVFGDWFVGPEAALSPTTTATSTPDAADPPVDLTPAP